MQTKLTLKLQERLIVQAKEYAQTSGKSLSQIVADYFSLLIKKKVADQKATAPLPPITQRLKGILAKPALSINKDDYKRYLEDKYL